MRLLIALLLLAGCTEDDGPNSQHCVEVRMRWLEVDYLRRQARDANDTATAAQRALLQDSIANADLKCFPDFALRVQ